MKPEITEQERKSIEEAAKGQAPTSDDAFFHYSDQDIWKEGFGFGAEFALTELRKPSEPEPIGRTDEDLVQKITDIIELNSWEKINTDLDRQLDFDIESIATEIAKLLPSSRSQENDVNGILYEKGTPATPHSEPPVNVELLEAAKYFREAWNCEWSKLTAKCDDVNKHSLAIANYEKQMKL